MRRAKVIPLDGAGWTENTIYIRKILRSTTYRSPFHQKEHLAIKLNPDIYDAYAGQYTFAAGSTLPGTLTLTVKRDEDALICQIAGQYDQAFAFPESETEFLQYDGVMDN